MPRFKIIVFAGGLLVVVAFLAAVMVFPATHPLYTSNGGVVATPSSSSASAPLKSPFGSNAFGPGIIVGQAPSDTGTMALFQGKPVATLGDVSHIVASATIANTSSQVPLTPSASLLALPDVPDNQIAIDPAGAATAMDLLLYFNEHYNNIAFNGQQFDSVLKDKNGVVLFTPGLINKAIADNNFAEIHDSLLVQENFAAAEINFFESIKVTGQAVALDKEAIGLEDLTIQLINNAINVGSGSMSKNNFLSFYGQFNATVKNAQQGFVAQSGILSMNPSPDFWDRWLSMFGMGTPAQAQSAGTPFGGTVLVIQPCPCDVGVNVTIGSPVPASIFVPIAFLSSPLFFSDEALEVGAWWLGLDNVAVQVPCAQAPACEPTDLGATIIMTGTSPPL